MLFVCKRCTFENADVQRKRKHTERRSSSVCRPVWPQQAHTYKQKTILTAKDDLDCNRLKKVREVADI